MGVKEIGIALLLIIYSIHAMMFALGAEPPDDILNCVDQRAIDFAKNLEGQGITSTSTSKCTVSNLEIQINNIRTALNSDKFLGLKIWDVASNTVGAITSIVVIGLYLFSIMFIGWHTFFVTIFGSSGVFSVGIFIFGSILTVIQILAVMFILFDVLSSVRP